MTALDTWCVVIYSVFFVRGFYWAFFEDEVAQ